MASVDQRTYLKKYMDDDDSKHRKKKKREHTSRFSDRVKIVDDDGEYVRKKKYVDDNDFILTGEDAPQIVGVVDERPPELKAEEDFRNSSKWRSLVNMSDRNSKTESRPQGNGQKHSDRKRSRSPAKRDYSPPRRSDRRDIESTSRKRSEDYSPPRRRRDADSRPKETESKRRDSESKLRGEDHRRDDSQRPREELHRQRENSHRQREDSHRQRDDHNRQREDPPRQREEPPRQREDPPRQREDPYRQREDAYRQREDPHRQREDPPRQREDPPRQREDPYRQREDPHRQREDPQRQREDFHRQREANHYKNEKSTTHTDGDYARRRDEYSRPTMGNSSGQYKEPQYSSRDDHKNLRSVSYVKHISPQPHAQRNQHEIRRQDYPSNQNGRSADYYPRESHNKEEYTRSSRSDSSRINPFRANASPTRSAHSSMPHRNDYNRKKSPSKSSNNPFRTNPRPISLSPLPDKRGKPTVVEARPSVRMQKHVENRNYNDDYSARSLMKRSSQPQYESAAGKGSNPFREEKSRDQPPAQLSRSSMAASVKTSRFDTLPSSYRPAAERAVPPRSIYRPEYEKRAEGISQGARSYRKSRSPIKSGIQVVNAQPPRSDAYGRYHQEKSEQANRYASTAYPAERPYFARK